jgi:hypothetical protein
VKLVLQCAMCGTHHPVGTPVCSTCRASGVTQLRLMFECESCGRLGLNPFCETCPPPAQLSEPIYELEDLIVAEEIVDDPFALDLDAIDALEALPLDIDDEDGEGEDDIFVVDASGEAVEDDSDFEEPDPDSEPEDPDDEDFEVELGDESEEDEDVFDQDFDEEEVEDEEDD